MSHDYAHQDLNILPGAVLFRAEIGRHIDCLALTIEVDGLLRFCRKYKELVVKVCWHRSPIEDTALQPQITTLPLTANDGALQLIERTFTCIQLVIENPYRYLSYSAFVVLD